MRLNGRQDDIYEVESDEEDKEKSRLYNEHEYSGAESQASPEALDDI